MYRVSVHPSTWYVLRVTARNSAGSTDCFLKFQTARHDSSSAVPRQLVVRYQLPVYERIEVIIPFCGVVITIVLVIIAVAIYRRRRRELQAERLAAKVRIVHGLFQRVA